MAEATAFDHCSALGAVEYDMHVLAAALLLRRYPPPADASNDPKALRQLAGDALLLKMRALLEFLGLLDSRNGRLFSIGDFKLDTLPQDRRFGVLFGHISQRCAHLTKDRAKHRLWVWPHLDRAGLLVLALCAEASYTIRATGLFPSRSAQSSRHTVLLEQLRLLGLPTQLALDAGTWPSNQAMELTARLAALAPVRPTL